MQVADLIGYYMREFRTDYRGAIGFMETELEDAKDDELLQEDAEFEASRE